MKIYAGQATGSFAVDGALNVSGSIAVSGLVDGIDLQALSSSLDTNKASVTELSDVSGALALAISSISTDFADITNKPTLISSSLQFNTLDTPFTGSFTGSFYGDGSNLSGVTSYTDADTLTYINSLGVVSSSAQINTGSFSGSFTGEFTGDGSGLTNLPFNNSTTASFALTSSITVEHGLGSKSITVDVYDSSDILIIPQQVTLVDNNNVKVDFAGATSGHIVISKGGHIISGSIASQLTGLATTGSNNFIGDQIITGSLVTSGSKVEFNVAWPAEGSEQHIIKTEPFIVSSSQGLKSFSYGAFALEHHTEDGGYEHNAFKLYMYDDHTNPSYGSELLIGPVRAQMTINASGSNALGNISTQDVGDGTTRTLLYGNLVQLGAVLTDSVLVGNATAAVEISGSSIGISGSTTIAGNLDVTGTITAQEFHTEYVSSSIVYQSGSTKFGDTSDDIHQFTGSVTVTGGVTGSVKATGHIIPSENNLFDLGTPTNQFRHLYLSTASLYMDGTKILSSNADTLTFTTDVGQSIKILETGADDITLQTDTGNIELKGTVEILSGKKITDSAATVIQFGDSLGVSGSIQVSGTVDGIDLQLMSSSLATRVSNVEIFSSSFSTDFADITNKPTLISSSAQFTDSTAPFTGSFSGSFYGDGSNLSGVTSYTDADTLAYINSINVVSGSFLSLSTVSDTFTSATSHTVTHNFGTKEVIVSVYENDTLIFPSTINTPTVNTVTVTFPEAITGRVVVVKAGHIVSGSIEYSNILNKPALISSSAQISTISNSLIPDANEQYDLGEPENKFRDLYLSSGTIYLGNSTISEANLVTTSSLQSSLPTGVVSSSAQIASDISGSVTLLSSSLVQRIGTLSGATGSYAIATTVDEAIQLTSGTLANRVLPLETSVTSLNSVTSSYLLNTTDTLEGDLTVTGKVTAQEFHTEYISSSIVYQSGSTKFGDTSDDTHQFTGSLNSKGNLDVVGTISVNGANNGNVSQLSWTRTDSSWAINNETNLRFYQSNSNTKTPSDLKVQLASNGLAYFYGQGVASGGTINLESEDPFIRLYDNGAGSTTDKKKWDIRVIGATNSEGFEIRTINDANNSFSSKLFIKHSGEVGIGTTLPDTMLEILYPSYIDKDTSQGLLRLVGQSNSENTGNQLSAGTAIEFYNKWSGGAAYSVGRIAGRGSQSYDGGLQFDVAQNTAPGQSNFVNAVTILKTTDVGIGTTTPGYKLTVKSPGNSVFPIAVTNTSDTLIGGFYQTGAGSGQLYLYDSSSNEKVKISTIDNSHFSGGNVGIGTTTPGAILTTYVGSGAITGTNDGLRLQVASYSTGARNTIAWHQDSSDLNLGRFGLEWNNPTTEMNFVWRDVYNGGVGTTELMRLTGGGKLGINDTSPGGRLTIKAGTSYTDNTEHQIKLVNAGYRNGALGSYGEGGYLDFYFQNYSGGNGRWYDRVLDIVSKGSPDGTYGEGVIRFLANPVTAGSNPNLIASINGSGYLRLHGSGIQFNGDTAAANALDDYEEGTFTPVIGDGTYTYSDRRGHYVKIGNMVYIHIGFRLASASPGSSTASISGLPYAGTNYGSYREPHARVAVAGACVTANLSYNLSFYLSNNSTTLYARTSSGNADTPVASNAIWQAGTFIKYTLIYTVS